MKDSTLIRIKVPKALYESAFKKALLEAAEKAKTKKRLKEAISGTEEELKAFYEKVKQIEAEGTDIDSAIQYALFDMTNPTAAAELSNDQLAEASAKTSKEEKKQADAKKEKAAKAKKAEAEKKAEADKKAKKAETEKKAKKPKTIDEALQRLMAKGKK